MHRALFLLFLSCLCSKAEAADKLPDLLNQAPAQSFQILGPISATKKNLEEAQIELLHQGQKLEADAVILKDCKSGSIQRDGLTWYKAQAACEGLAIRFNKTISPKTPSPAKVH